jgi:hypothetical protein
MSSTVSTSPSIPIDPKTNSAVDAANGLVKLVVAAEAEPVVKADLEAQFDSYSHSPLIVGLTSIAGMMLTREHVTVDNTLLTVLVGAVVTGIGYAWQWASMRMRKPVKVTTP